MSTRDMEPLDFKSLRYFVRVVELRSFSKAAVALRIAQPAISRQIQKLESQLGVKLLLRSVRGIETTECGQMLFERATDILSEISELPAEVRAREDEPSGVVLLAVSPGAGKIIVPEVFERLHSSFPKIELRIVEAFTGIIEQGLFEQKFDLGLFYLTIDLPTVSYEILLNEPLFVIDRRKKQKSFSKRKSYQLKDLVGEPLILAARPNQSRMQTEELMAREKLPLTVAMEIDSIPIQLALVQKGFGKAVLSYGAVHAEVMRGVLSATPIKSPDAFRKLIIARNTTRRETVAIRTVGTLVREVAHDLVATNKWPGAVVERVRKRP